MDHGPAGGGARAMWEHVNVQPRLCNTWGGQGVGPVLRRLQCAGSCHLDGHSTNRLTSGWWCHLLHALAELAGSQAGARLQGRWLDAQPAPGTRRSGRVQALEEMAAQGLRPDVGVLNILVNMLTSCGLVPTQLKAAQLFFGASRQGQLRHAVPAHAAGLGPGSCATGKQSTLGPASRAPGSGATPCSIGALAASQLLACAQPLHALDAPWQSS